MASPKTQQSETDSPSDASSETDERTIDQARLFLQDETVRAASPQKRRTFLESKGYDDAQISQLEAELAGDTQVEDTVPAADSSSTPTSAPTSGPTSSADPAMAADVDTPPIITYPEFLTTAPRPPPLITPSRLANILAVSGGIWALLYGVAGLVINPMVENLHSARSDYYAHVGGKLDELNQRLARVVSKVPPRPTSRDNSTEDTESVNSDPTEMFHRDVGTQTTDLPQYTDAAVADEKPIDAHVRRLAALKLRLSGIRSTKDQTADKAKELRTLIGEVREGIETATNAPRSDFSSYNGLSYGRSAEPDDEFKKTKDAIRGVKGLLLSSRNFPAVNTR
ncbi:hypothetical protein F5Y18DRAFT_107473 [Xylariaceae sp. FL1019]|nr:hypothetical protein F5Y18DRAFT_107473 [Xylariaceae sp. FL1019]